MRKQFTATALVMTLGLAAPVLAQEEPIFPKSDPTQQTDPAPRQTRPQPQPDSGMDAPRDTAPAPADKTSSADRERAAQPAGSFNGEEYVVQKGDTLSGLAARFLGSADHWKQIADANSIQNPNALAVGQKLQIPKNGSGAGAAPASRSQDGEVAPSRER